ncbi:MAG: hypothetical protein ACOZNI_29435 [Myxococcota bacterium]
MTLLLLACVHPSEPTLDGCAAGDLAMCHALAAAPDDPVAAMLDAWACEEGHAPSCDATAARMGWRDARVAGVKLLRDVATRVHVVSSGGTVIGFDRDGDLVVAGPDGTRTTPMPHEADRLDPRAVRELVLTADGRLLAYLDQPGAVWSVLDGGAVSVAAWPALTDRAAFSADGRVLAVALAGHVAWWELPSGRPSGVAPAVAQSVALSPDGRWTAANGALFDRGRQTSRVADCPRPAMGPEGRMACATRGGVRLVGGAAGTVTVAPDETRVSWSPDGATLAVAADDHVRLFTLPPGGLPADAGTVVKLPPIDAARPLVWSPDGQRLAVALDHAGFAVVSLAGARDDAATDAAIVKGVRTPPGPPRPAEPAYAADLAISRRVTMRDAPVRNAEVRAVPCSPGVPSPAPAFTGDDGTFKFARLPAGCWDLEIRAAGAIPWRGRADGDVALVPTTRVEGLVRGPDRRPAAGVTVRVAEPVEVVATTDTRGRFVLDGVPEPGFRVTASRDGERVEADVVGPKIELSLAPLAEAPAPAEAAPTGSVRVFLPRRGEGDRLEVDGEPCPPTPDGCHTGPLSPGRHTVRVHLADHRHGVAEVDVPAGEPTVVPAPVDGALGALVGRVVDVASRRPLAGVVVAVACGGEVVRARTGPDGRFRLDALAPATEVVVDLVPTGAWFRAASRTTAVKAGETDLGDVPLAP